MFEQLCAILVDLRDAGVALESCVAPFADPSWEVFAVVEVFEEGAYGLEVLVGELDGAVLG